MQQQAGCGSHCRSGRSMPHVAAATVGLSASASANRCHHRLTDRVTVLDAQRCTCHMRQAGTDCTPLHLKCRGQTFWNCNFRLDFKVASAPYFACSSAAAPLPCISFHSSPALCARATPTEHKCNLLRWAVAGCTSRSGSWATAEVPGEVG